MLCSAVFTAVLGVAATFLPQEILLSVGATTHPFVVLMVQITGALYLGFAFLNWSTRSNLIGGIYGRPLVIGNLMHYLITGLALVRVLGNGETAPIIWSLTVVYVLFATGYALLMFRHPKKDEGSG